MNYTVNIGGESFPADARGRRLSTVPIPPQEPEPVEVKTQPMYKPKSALPNVGDIASLLTSITAHDAGSPSNSASPSSTTGEQI